MESIFLKIDKEKSHSILIPIKILNYSTYNFIFYEKQV